MTERLIELEKICSIIEQNPKEVPIEIRKRFWKIVRQIKKDPKPDEEEVYKASEIRNLLFEASRGRTFPLIPVLMLETVLGLLALWGYIWALGTPLDWMGIFAWGLAEWMSFGLRFVFVFAVIAFLYPIGRVIAGKWAGIKLEGMCRDQYYEPTVKIDYVSFLKAPASKRKWFFFFAGLWTLITSLWLWILGMFLSWDFTAFIPMILLALFEGSVILSGNPSPNRGEMGHYNREKRIEQVWRRKLAVLNETSQDDSSDLQS
ncbi:MAG: hypothetical protein AM326_04270 [Candidatus Thorarchaeota archaeon SMTZ-45]|nr:MAG: hypothetical protein AM326_04270 [Candidatus Thorarchaeota archaeon SMTZ-45]KXH74514.1 MAG: hypothetical protein AM325_05930 [Candidatus Thorarchaeota archaeon SMTZ1-45]